MTRLLTIILFLFAPPAWAEDAILVCENDIGSYELKITKNIPLNEVQVEFNNDKYRCKVEAFFYKCASIIAESDFNVYLSINRESLDAVTSVHSKKPGFTPAVERFSCRFPKVKI